MEASTNIKVKSLKVDGGASSNNLLMDFQSNILGIDIERPVCIESTALGAAYLAGLTLGVYSSLDEIAEKRIVEKKFTPTKTDEWRETHTAEWKKAVSRSLGWKS